MAFPEGHGATKGILSFLSSVESKVRTVTPLIDRMLFLFHSQLKPRAECVPNSFRIFGKFMKSVLLEAKPSFPSYSVA